MNNQSTIRITHILWHACPANFPQSTKKPSSPFANTASNPHTLLSIQIRRLPMPVHFLIIRAGQRPLWLLRTRTEIPRGNLTITRSGILLRNSRQQNYPSISFNPSTLPMHSPDTQFNPQRPTIKHKKNETQDQRTSLTPSSPPFLNAPRIFSPTP